MLIILPVENRCFKTFLSFYDPDVMVYLSDLSIIESPFLFREQLWWKYWTQWAHWTLFHPICGQNGCNNTL